jgi:hypothetical protein
MAGATSSVQLFSSCNDHEIANNFLVILLLGLSYSSLKEGGQEVSSFGQNRFRNSM